MIRFRKAYNAKIISMIMIIVFVATNTSYGISLPDKTHLRVSIGLQDTYNRVEKAQSSVAQGLYRKINIVLIIAMLLGGTLLLDQPPVDTIKKNYYELLEQHEYYKLSQSMDKIIDYPWAEDIIEEMVENSPRLALWALKEAKSEKYLDRVWGKYKYLAEMFTQMHGMNYIKDKDKFRKDIEPKIMEAPFEAFYIQDPVFLGKGPPSMYFINEYLLDLFKDSQNSVIRKIEDLCEWAKGKGYPMHEVRWPKAILLIDKIVKDELSFEAAHEITKDPALFIRNLIEIKTRPDHIGSYSVDRALDRVCLRAVEKINRLHESPDPVRFASVEEADAELLYNFMVYGENEVYTSTFNGLFTRMLDRMRAEGLTAKDLLEKEGYNKFRSMIRLCANYNRLNDFLNTMIERDQIELLERFVTIKEDVKDLLSQAVAIADAFSMIEDRNALRVIQQTIKKEHETAEKEGNREIRIVYGLLSGMFAEKAVLDIEWFKEIAEKYNLPDITKLPANSIFDNGLNIQRFYTYNDEDGEASYNNILNQYDGRRDWSVIDRATYTIIKSESLDGRMIAIYINKPEFEDKGHADIDRELQGKTVQVEIHVGHSYYAEKTIERINPNAPLVVLRSCGGYNEVSSVLNKNLAAQIISTKGKGTMYVNDPLLYLLNTEILKGRDIIWPDFWQKAERVLGNNENFNNYIAPHKNLGALFLKAYHELIKQKQAIGSDSERNEPSWFFGILGIGLQGFRNIRRSL